MMLIRPPLVAIFGLLWALPLNARAGILYEDWLDTPGGSPDGVAIGDLDGDGRMEAAFILRGGDFVGRSKPGTGTLSVVDTDGTPLWQVQTGWELVGFPTIADFDGDGMGEVAFCELMDEGMCHVYDGNGTLLYSVGPYFYPAMTNAGPSAADLNGDGIDDLIIADYGGVVHASLGPLGAPYWEYDLWSTHGDYPFGHLAIGDLDNDGTMEVLVGGAERGGFYALNSENGTEQWARPDIYALYQNVFMGNGPTIANLDADPQLEVVAAMPGSPGPAAVLALDSDGSLLWRTEVPSETFYYMNAAAADTNGDGQSEVLVMGISGTLLQFAGNDGSLLDQVFLGDQSWASPTFTDVDFDLDMEIVVSTLSGVYVLQGDLSEVDRYENQGAGLFPPPALTDIDGDGRLDMITGAWFPHQLISVDLGYPGMRSWSTFGGGNQHRGSVPPRDTAGLGKDPIVTVSAIHDVIQNLMPQTTGTAFQELEDATEKLSEGFRRLLRGKSKDGLDRLKQAIEQLQDVPAAGYDTGTLQEIVAATAIEYLEMYIERVAAVAGPTKNDVVDALERLANARAAYAIGDWWLATDEAKKGGEDIDGFGGTPDPNFCGPPLTDPYKLWMCKINDVRTSVQQLLTLYPSSSNLSHARDDLKHCVEDLPDMDFIPAFEDCLKAQADLALVSVTNTSALRDDMTFAIMKLTRRFIDQSRVWFGDVDPSALAAAESFYANGVSAYSSASYGVAIQAFLDAVKQARPCDNINDGLEGGGC